jgi:hypothetical protein
MLRTVLSGALPKFWTYRAPFSSSGVLAEQGESKTVVVDPQATYFGTPLATKSLLIS